MENNNVITYETIYEILRKEKYRNELQKLDKNFVSEVINYLQDKVDFIESQKTRETLFSSEVIKVQKQVENLHKMLREVYDKRENKIIQLALFSSRTGVNNVDTNAMLDEELQLYSQLKEVLASFRERILKNILTAKHIEQNKPKELKREEIQPEVKLLKFKRPIPQFVGDDLNLYGPFEDQSTSSLPLNVAKLLIKEGSAEEI